MAYKSSTSEEGCRRYWLKCENKTKKRKIRAQLFKSLFERKYRSSIKGSMYLLKLISIGLFIMEQINKHFFNTSQF